MANYSYGGLQVRVTADTSQLTVQVRQAAEQAGGQAAQAISSRLQTGLKAVGGIAASVGKAAAAGLTGATVAAAGFGVASFKAAARVGEMNASLKALAAANKVSYPAMQQSVKQIRQQGIEASTAQDLVAQFTRQQLKLSDATKLARVAQDAAVISGRNSTEVLADLTHGITTQNTQVLRNAGVTVQAGQAIDRYAKAHGRAVKDLTDSERAQAVLNAVLVEGKNVAGAYESAMREPGKVLRSFPRIIDDVKVSVGEGLVRAFGPAILSGYDLAKSFSHAVAEGGPLAPMFEAVGAAVARIVKPIADMAARWADWVAKLRPDQIERVTGAISRFGPAALAGAGGLAAMTAPALLGQVPVLGGLLNTLAGPAQLVGKHLGSVGIQALSAIPGMGGMGASAGTLGAALGSVALPVVAVVAALAALLIVSPKFRAAVLAIGQALMGALRPALSAIVAGFKLVLPPVLDVIRALGDALAPILLRLAPLLGPLGQLVGVVLRVAFTILGVALKLVAAILVPLIQLLGWLIDKVLAVVVPVVLLAANIALWTARLIEVVNPVKWLGAALLWLLGPVQTLVKWITGGSPGLIPAFTALAAVVAWTMAAVRAIVSATMSAVTSLVSGAWSAISSATTGWWARIGTTVTGALNKLRAAVSATGGWMTGFLAGVWSQIQAGAARGWFAIVSTIATTFNRVRDAVAAPVRWVVNAVINPLIRGINVLIKAIGLAAIPAIPAFAQGGKVPGGWGGGDRVIAAVEPGEWVLTKEQARGIGYGNLRRLPRYAEGGEVMPQPFLPGLGALADLGGAFVRMTHLDDLARAGRDLVDEFSGMLQWAASQAFQLLVAPLKKSIEPWAGDPQVFPKRWLGKTVLDVIEKSVEFIAGKALGACDASGVVAHAMTFNGKPYRWGGGANPSTGFDCSSFVSYIAGSAGLPLPGGFRVPSAGHGPVTTDYLGFGGMTTVPLSQAQPGAVAVNPHHIGFIIGPNGAGFAARSTATGIGPQSFASGYTYRQWAGGGAGDAGPCGAGAGAALPYNGKGVPGWATSILTQVTGMLGIPWARDAFISQARTESNFNTAAVNNWDSNAKAGTPSKGWLQVIQPTFNAYCGPFCARGIFDPLANAYAAANYAKSRYGARLLSVIGRGHGYAAGGVVSEPVVGFGVRSGQPYSFAERGPELVSPLTGAPPGAGAALRTVINVYPQPGQDERQIAAMVSRELAWAAAGGA